MKDLPPEIDLVEIESLISKISSPITNELESNKNLSENKARQLHNRLWHSPVLMLNYYLNSKKLNTLHSSFFHRNEWYLTQKNKISETIGKTPYSIQFQDSLSSNIRPLIQKYSFHPWKMENISRYFYLLNNPNLWDYLPEEYPDNFTIDMAKALISHSNSNPEHHFVRAIYYKEEIIGQIRLQFSPKSSEVAEISYWLGEGFLGAEISFRNRFAFHHVNV